MPLRRSATPLRQSLHPREESGEDTAVPPHVHTRVIAHDLPAREEDLALVDVDDGVLHPSHSLQDRLEDGNGLPGPLLQPGGLQLPRLQARLRRQHPHGERLARAWGAVQQHDRILQTSSPKSLTLE